LENSAGYNNSVGSKLEEIKTIMELSGSHAGVCIDTCHAFAAGYELNTVSGARAFAKSIRDNFGGIGLIHLNDSKYGLGSGLDRHEQIGNGKIGAEGFANLFANREFTSGSAIIEVPGGEIELRENLSVLSHLLSKCGVSLKGPD
jgi:endonuclease IV